MRIVLTGAPGSGKTSVIEELEKMGKIVVPEPARTLIENYKKNSKHLLPENDRNGFQLTVEKLTRDNFLDNELAFFDRSIIDEIGYRDRYKVEVSEDLHNFCNENRYDKVFIFPPWKEIFKNDDVRGETFEEAEKIDYFIHRAYIKYNYFPIIVPKASINDRLNFILNIINK